MIRPPRPVYPRIGCSVPACKRGATCFEPGVRFICGKCWRRAPKEMRRRYSVARRLMKRCEKRDDPRADFWARMQDARWQAVLDLLSAPEAEPEAGELPPLMAEELRKAGL